MQKINNNNNNNNNMEWSWLRIWTGGGGTCEYGNEPLGPIKCREFLDQLQNQLAFQEGLCSME
jgi:hypothetical protein